MAPVKSDADVLEYLASFVSQSRLARMESVLALRTRRFCIVLENVWQPLNASAVLRSAECFGVQDVHLITNEHKFKASKGITRGSHKWLNLYRHNARGIDNTVPCFAELRKQGYHIACMHPHAESHSLSDLDLGQKKVALVIGSEKEGLSQYALKNCDSLIKFPMYGYSESLNLSVLAALCMNEMRAKLNSLDPAVWKLSAAEHSELRSEWIHKSVREAAHLASEYKKRAQNPHLQVLSPSPSPEV